MKYNFKPTNRDQLYLLPPSVDEWRPEDHLVFFILDVVEQIDLRPFLRPHRSEGRGGKRYDAAVMAALLLDADCLGIRSSREIERRGWKISPCV